MFLWVNAISDHTILNDATIQKMFTAQIEEDGYNGNSSFGYGCNISKSRRNTKLIDNGRSNGIYFARLVRLPEEGVVFYVVTNEKFVNANMVIPNVTQLYFQGAITQDAMNMKPRFKTPAAEKIYNILETSATNNFEDELIKENINVDEDMILLDVGQKLIEQQKTDKALILYLFYTKTFPNIIVAWNDLGDVYLMNNNKGEAIKCFKQALILRADNPRAKENLERLTK